MLFSTGRRTLWATFTGGTSTAFRSTFAGWAACSTALASTLTLATALPFPAGRHRTEQFFPAQLPITVLVQGFEGNGGRSNFLSGKLPVLIGIEGHHHWGQHTTATTATRTSRTTGRAAGTTGGRSRRRCGRRWRRTILSVEQSCRGHKG
jgi:hypothetical protein